MGMFACLQMPAYVETDIQGQTHTSTDFTIPYMLMFFKYCFSILIYASCWIWCSVERHPTVHNHYSVKQEVEQGKDI